MSRMALAVAAAVFAWGVTGPASAATMRATLHGSVFSDGSLDQSGVFVGTGGTLDGLGFKLVFTYDPDTPGAERFTIPTADVVQGGTARENVSPMLSATLTINRRTVSFATDQEAWVQAYRFEGTDTLDFGSGWQERVGDPGDVRGKVLGVSARVDGKAGQFTTSLEDRLPLTRIVSADPGILTSNFHLLEYTIVGGEVNYPVNTYANLVPTSVEIAPVPAPAALPLLASALAALGVVGWRRRRAVGA